MERSGTISRPDALPLLFLTDDPFGERKNGSLSIGRPTNRQTLRRTGGEKHSLPALSIRCHHRDGWKVLIHCCSEPGKSRVHKSKCTTHCKGSRFATLRASLSPSCFCFPASPILRKCRHLQLGKKRKRPQSKESLAKVEDNHFHTKTKGGGGGGDLSPLQTWHRV